VDLIRRLNGLIAMMEEEILFVIHSTKKGVSEIAYPLDF
jgi:hypothetical protein